MSPKSLIAAAVLLVTVGCASLPNAETVSAPGGWNHVAQGGSGTPVVVLESGLGDGMDSWEKIFPGVARTTTVVAYTRRGYAGSSLVLSERTGSEIVDELRALLRKRGLRPPYVLVGHSIGGLYHQLFAKRYPDEVAGLVLVDPTHPDQFARMREESPREYRMASVMTTLNFASTVGAEFRGGAETGKAWHRAGPFPARPAIVLPALRPSLGESEEFVAFKLRLHEEIARAIPGAEHRRIADSRHYIQKENPAAVLAAIRDVIAKVPR